MACTSLNVALTWDVAQRGYLTGILNSIDCGGLSY
jgi:hypothetical protein